MTSAVQPLASRHRAFLPQRTVAQYFSGGPSLLVSTGLVPAGVAASDFGLDTIFASARGGDIYFFRGADGASDFAETAELPSDLLAIVATDGDAAELCALWTDRGLAPPPVIAVDSALQAVGPILARAKAEIAVLSARCAELQRALVATRAEFEETRTAMQGVMRTLSHRYATKMTLVAVVAPSRDGTVTIGPSTALRRIYPVGTELVTCCALHIAALQHAANAVLTVAFLGVESGRVLGKWRRPGEALFTGWNIFDFPTPVAAVRETIAIEVSLDGGEGCAVTFSLAGEDAAAEAAPLAIRVWTADAGGRFPHAEHWVWDAGGGTRPASGTVSLVGAAALARIVARGRTEAVHDGEADGRPASYLLRGGSSLLHLPDLSIRCAEGVCIELAHKFGDLRGTRFELAVQSPQHCFAGGWRPFGAADGVLRLGLSLPAVLPDVVDLFLCIEDDDRTEQSLAGIVLRQIEVIAGPRSALDVGPRAVRIYPEAWPLSGADPAEPRFKSLKATNYSEAEKYALFEVTIDGLAFGRRAGRPAKFKISKANGRLSIEFRQGQNWPKIFQEWPGRERDRFGDVFRVAHAGERLAIAGMLAPGPDNEVLAALSSLMPAIIAAGMQNFPSAREQIPHWLDAARAFAAAGQATFGGPGA